MASLTSTTLIVRSLDLMAVKIDDDLVMMGIEQGEYYGISGVGSYVWELLAQPVSIEDITRSILANYDVDEKTCQADIQAFIEDLVRLGLVLPA